MSGTVTGMIAVTVNMVVAPGDGPKLEAVIGKLAEATLANEPGVKLYRLCRSPEDASRFRLFEIYEDQATFDSHLQTAWFKEARPHIMPLLIEQPMLERYDVLA